MGFFAVREDGERVHFHTAGGRARTRDSNASGARSLSLMYFAADAPCSLLLPFFVRTFVLSSGVLRVRPAQ